MAKTICGACNKEVMKGALEVQCVDCSACFHLQCVQVTKDLKEEEEIKRFAICGVNGCKSTKFQSQLVVEQEVVKTKIEMESKQTQTEADSREENLLKFVNVLTNCNQHLRKNNVDMTAAHCLVAKKLGSLESKQKEIEQYYKRNSVRIEGLTVSDRGNILEIAKRIGSAESSGEVEKITEFCNQLGSLLRKVPNTIVKFVRWLDNERQQESFFSAKSNMQGVAEGEDLTCIDLECEEVIIDYGGGYGFLIFIYLVL